MSKELDEKLAQLAGKIIELTQHQTQTVSVLANLREIVEKTKREHRIGILIGIIFGILGTILALWALRR